MSLGDHAIGRCGRLARFCPPQGRALPPVRRRGLGVRARMARYV